MAGFERQLPGKDVATLFLGLKLVEGGGHCEAPELFHAWQVLAHYCRPHCHEGAQEEPALWTEIKIFLTLDKVIGFGYIIFKFGYGYRALIKEI